MTHTKDEALKLALDNLIAEYDMETSSFAKRVNEIFKQALAAQPAPVQEPVALGQEREAFEAWHDSFFVNKGHAAHHRFHDRDGYCIDDIQNQWKGWKERAKRTTPPAAPVPLTDDQIRGLTPKPDGVAEGNVRRVEVLPGVMGTEFDEVDAWSMPLVLQIARSIEAAHGITKGQP